MVVGILVRVCSGPAVVFAERGMKAIKELSTHRAPKPLSWAPGLYSSFLGMEVGVLLAA